jgi:Kef-type K+ transport system membrane component KefB
MNATIPPFFVVLVAAIVAPLIAHAIRRLGVPVVVIEILLGVAIGPQMLGWASSEGAIPYLASFGLAFLFFLAGMEIDLFTIRGRPLNLAIAGWTAGMAVACAIAIGLRAVGLVDAWLIVAIALMTTALGIVVPVLRDAGDLETPFGLRVIATGVMGELGPILTMSLALSTKNGAPWQTALTASFIAVVIVTAWLLTRSRDIPGFLGLLRRSMTQSSQLPVRICLLILASLVVLAQNLDLDLALGALAAGMVVSLATQGLETETLHLKLDAIGFGFLAPVFFINSGMNLDVAAAFGTTSGLLLAGAFFVALIVTRLPAVVLQSPELGSRRAMALGMYSATTLGMVVALSQIGVEGGLMNAAEAASLIAGAIMSMVLFPAMGVRLVEGHAIPNRAVNDRAGL